VGDLITPYAGALEMIHTSSLIMDDIMDGHTLRRGKPTCFVKYGTGIALMASQFICSEAYLLISDSRCMNEILHTIRDMCIGQSTESAELKTGSLIRTSVRIGAILGGASEEQLEALTQYGDQIGLLFQVRDDMLDGDRPEEALEVDLQCLEIFGDRAEQLQKIAYFIVERTI
jgi:geranylgeranyl diphosphate synthase, type II